MLLTVLLVRHADVTVAVLLRVSSDYRMIIGCRLMQTSLDPDNLSSAGLPWVW